MDRDNTQFSDADCSCLLIGVVVEESWIDQFLTRQQLTIPVSEKYSLDHIKVDLKEGRLTLMADIIEKEGSAIQITCFPKWDADKQTLLLEQLDIRMLSKNILLKSAGWLANTFLGGKIDKKIEDSTNQLYAHHMEKILKEGITVPLPDGSSAAVQVRSINIREMTFVDHTIQVKAMIDGYWKLNLTSSHPG